MARIGTVGYLNARPLRDRIDVDRHTVVLAHPAEVARLLAAGEVDVALVPVAAVLGRPELRVVPGVCIGAEGAVGSVLLAAETPPEEWTTVRLDGVSRTSVVLAELLLRHGPLAARVRPDLAIVHVDAADGLAGAGGTVAALVIGDHARTLDPRWVVRLDLGTWWTAWTGLPFVFAVWAGRAGLDPALVRHLRKAGEEGVAAIATTHAGDDLRYLTENLRYPLDDRALMGVRRFAALAAGAGLLPEGHLELFGPAPAPARPDVDDLLLRAVDGEPLTESEATALLRDAPLADLAAAADAVRHAVTPRNEVGWSLGGPSRGTVVIEASDPAALSTLVGLRGAPGDLPADIEVRSGTASASEHLRLVAISRLVLRTVPIVVSARSEGLGPVQIALSAGADRASAGIVPQDDARRSGWILAMERQIREAGFVPVEVLTRAG
jgi:predicted solute-binding protein